MPQLTSFGFLLLFFSIILDRRKSSIGGETTQSRTSHRSVKSNKSALGRKLEPEFNKSNNAERRRMKSNDKIISSSSSSCSESENDTEIDIVLNKNRHHLEDTEALKIRRQLLRPEDFVSNLFPL